jgi:CheY-like chemotaxis protein
MIAIGNRSLDADYAAANPEVTPGEYVMVEVTDTGSGMPPEVVARIFEPFYTTKGPDQGTGLGLSMVFGFLKQSGGHVSVYSEAGIGTTFRLYLPCASAAATEEAAAREAATPSSLGELVLVVEDNPGLRRLAVRQLRELGYRIVEAKDGAEALERLASAKIDLLFTDIVMPGDIDGFALADTTSRQWPKVKVLLTSGFPQTKLRDSMEPSRFRLLTKPYRKSDLAQALSNLLHEPEAVAATS